MCIYIYTCVRYIRNNNKNTDDRRLRRRRIGSIIVETTDDNIIIYGGDGRIYRNSRFGSFSKGIRRRIDRMCHSKQTDY